jgi:hypothetical protein
MLNSGMVLLAGGVGINNTVSLASAELYNPATETFTYTSGSMNTAREFHAATLLNNGLVLITGGQASVGGTILASAELYNPATGTFTNTTGSMNAARESHTATLLSNGMVLIAGGVGNSGVLASEEELYNPATETFTYTTGSLNTARELHTATLLNNGMVLIAGGEGSSGALASVELYNPATGTFTSTVGNLNTARYLHTATLLNNGMALIAGGQVSDIAIASAELYNPATGTFTFTTGSLSTARYYHTATLLNNGEVLVAGGYGGSGNPGFLASGELYNPAAGTFAATAGSLNAPRMQFTTTLLNNGELLVAAGWGNDEPLSSAELYPPTSLTPPGLISISLSPVAPWVPIGGSLDMTATGTFSGNTTETLASASWTSSTTSVAAITNDPSNLGHVDAIASGTTTIKACTGSICGSTTLTVAPHTNLIIGSAAGEGGTFETHDDSGNLVLQGNLDMSRTSHSATLLINGTVFVAGGQGDPSSWEILNVNGQTLSSGTLLNGFYSHLAARLTNGNVFLAGGVASPGAWEIHSSTGALVSDGSLTGKRTPGAGIVVLQNGNIWISGSGASTKSDECTWEILDINGNPVSNGVLTTCFASGKVFLLSNGDVLLVGGFNAPNTYEIHTQAGVFFSTGNIVNGFDNSAGAAQLGNNVFLFESGFCEFVGFDANANLSFDFSNGCTLFDSRLGSKAVVTSTGEFFITGGSAAAGTWEMWKPSGSTVTPVGNGNLFDDRNVGHSDTHF